MMTNQEAREHNKRQEVFRGKYGADGVRCGNPCSQKLRRPKAMRPVKVVKQHRRYKSRQPLITSVVQPEQPRTMAQSEAVTRQGLKVKQFLALARSVLTRPLW